MPGEFELIARHFAALTPARGGVVLGPGDDAALLDLPPGHELVVTVDTLVAGVHFFDDCPPAALGHKALAVNLSDLAAMGAEPAWALLALTLPVADDAWLAQFASGFAALAREFDVSLVGGDTCRGPLAISVTALGHAPRGQALRRRGARPGDGVYVSGEIGAAGLAVQARRGEIMLPAALATHAARRLGNHRRQLHHLRRRRNMRRCPQPTPGWNRSCPDSLESAPKFAYASHWRTNLAQLRIRLAGPG